jgi:hypothetical protein
MVSRFLEENEDSEFSGGVYTRVAVICEE